MSSQFHGRGGLHPSIPLLLMTLLGACGRVAPPQPVPEACEQVDCGPGVCEQRDGQAVCNCPTGYVPTGQGCTQEPAQGGDDHGDTRSKATVIEPGQGQGVVDSKEDVDVFSFRVVAGRVYVFTCLAGYSMYDPTCAVRLTSATGEPLTSGAGFWEVGSKATEDGTLYAEVRHASEPAGFPHPYQYVLRDAGTDDHGDTPETATAVLPSTTAADARFEMPRDVDAFAFDAAAVGQIYKVSCMDGPICHLRLRDPSGTVLGHNTGSLIYKTVQAGRHAVEMSGSPELFKSGAGSYRYKIEYAGLDDHGDDAASATELLPGAATEGTLHTTQDVDAFRFTAPAGRRVRFTCSQQDTSDGCYIRLSDGAGTFIQESQGAVIYEAGSTPAALIAEVFYGLYTRSFTYTYQLEILDPQGP